MLYGEIGLMLLLLEAGLTIDIDMLKKIGVRGFLVGTIGEYFSSFFDFFFQKNSFLLIFFLILILNINIRNTDATCSRNRISICYGI